MGREGEEGTVRAPLREEEGREVGAGFVSDWEDFERGRTVFAAADDRGGVCIFWLLWMCVALGLSVSPASNEGGRGEGRVAGRSGRGPCRRKRVAAHAVGRELVSRRGQGTRGSKKRGDGHPLYQPADTVRSGDGGLVPGSLDTRPQEGNCRSSVATTRATRRTTQGNTRRPGVDDANAHKRGRRRGDNGGC